MSNIAVYLKPGSDLTVQLDFRPDSFRFDNPTAQWWHCIEADIYIQPYVLGCFFPLNGASKVTFKAEGPVGQQSSVIAGEQAIAVIDNDPDFHSMNPGNPITRPLASGLAPVYGAKLYKATQVSPAANPTPWNIGAIAAGLQVSVISVFVSARRTIASSLTNATVVQVAAVDGTGNVLPLCSIGLDNAAVGAYASDHASMCGILPVGYNLEGLILDNNADGSIEYTLSAQYITSNAA